MNKICYTAFIAFCASIATIVALDMLADEPDATSDSPSITLEELARHDTLEDCWMAIEAQVYDLTDYVKLHPTPPSILEPWCGIDATKGMRTKGYGRDHSQSAWNALETYRVGTLRTADPEQAR